MTNLVSPVAPYENVKFYTKDGKAAYKGAKGAPGGELMNK